MHDPLEELFSHVQREARRKAAQEAHQEALDRVFFKRAKAQAIREHEAAQAAEKRQKFLALRQAFDAERFRWLAAHLDWLALKPYASWDIETLRDKIDSAIHQDP